MQESTHKKKSKKEKRREKKKKRKEKKKKKKKRKESSSESSSSSSESEDEDIAREKRIREVRTYLPNSTSVFVSDIKTVRASWWMSILFLLVRKRARRILMSDTKRQVQFCIYYVASCLDRGTSECEYPRQFNKLSFSVQVNGSCEPEAADFLEYEFFPRRHVRTGRRCNKAR